MFYSSLLYRTEVVTNFISFNHQAVCRHEVGWLMRALLTDFRSAGGDLRWLTSLHHAPSKLYALAPINNILAHQPWLLLPHHIQVCQCLMYLSLWCEICRYSCHTLFLMRSQCTFVGSLGPFYSLIQYDKTNQSYSKYMEKAGSVFMQIFISSWDAKSWCSLCISCSFM